MREQWASNLYSLSMKRKFKMHARIRWWEVSDRNPPSPPLQKFTHFFKFHIAEKPGPGAKKLDELTFGLSLTFHYIFLLSKRDWDQSELVWLLWPLGQIKAFKPSLLLTETCLTPSTNGNISRNYLPCIMIINAI